MTKRSKTRQAAPEIHAPDAHDQEPGIAAPLNPAGLTMAAEAPISDGAETHPVSGTTFLNALCKPPPPRSAQKRLWP